ncbi:MAG: cysteine--tRNA ligase [Defluviitaleaceae bacterium]|nr:cysteine--tRNA ligase [Defluviitaleaceae bacterium]
MKIYNTLTRKKEGFVPIKPGNVGIYVCGPTVYNFIHMGNARPYVVFDTLRRYLEFTGFTVTFVQNFTDIDDKIINKANEENINYTDIAERYIEEFFTDIDGLNIRRANFYPRVTEEIDEILDLVGFLLGEGFAYEVKGTVYFDARKATDYGKLSKKNIDDLEAGARVDVNPDKRSTSDFVLWKAAKPHEPAWESPWGWGRPGWHIECSVMARKYVGQTVDIHGGGEDLMFPHHENEIAQSEAEGGIFANYWMHNGMLLVDNQKMAKSDGNFFLVRDIARKYGYPLIRFYLLSVHYRSPLNFSEELLNAANAGLERIRECRRNLLDAGWGNDGETAHRQAFLDALADDLNTANAISAVFDLAKDANVALRENTANPAFLADLDFMCDLLGVVLENDGNINDADVSEIEVLVTQRDEAKKAKNWALADELRDKLTSMGVEIKDTRDGTKWHLTRG